MARSNDSTTERSEVYAVEIAGDSMAPRYFDGDVICVDPRRCVVLSDHTYVLVQFYAQEEGEAPMALIKKYERQTKTELVLSQFKPPKQLQFPIEMVEYIHAVCGTVRAL